MYARYVVLDFLGKYLYGQSDAIVIALDMPSRLLLAT